MSSPSLSPYPFFLSSSLPLYLSTSPLLSPSLADKIGLSESEGPLLAHAPLPEPHHFSRLQGRKEFVQGSTTPVQAAPAVKMPVPKPGVPPEQLLFHIHHEKFSENIKTSKLILKIIQNILSDPARGIFLLFMKMSLEKKNILPHIYHEKFLPCEFFFCS